MINLSSAAHDQILKIGGHLYLSLENGGCAEYKYKFSTVKSEFELIEYTIREVKVLIPLLQKEQLESVSIDYEVSLMRRAFVVKTNSYVSEKCGCGISFR